MPRTFFGESSRLAISILICQTAGVIGSFFTAPAVPGWYAGLVKPALTPPGWVFAPVWITLYLLMGVALYLVWRVSGTDRRAAPAIAAFAAQLGLNAAWSWLFFGLRNPLAGLIGIVLLLVAIAYTMILFRRISRAAFVLLIPYIIWTGFAAWLNYGLWRLNG